MAPEQPTAGVLLVSWVAEQASTRLAPLGNRWLHVQGVVAKARQVGATLKEEDRSSLIAAAYLHHIGYAPSLQRTGFHPIDGASSLRDHHQERLASRARVSLRGRGRGRFAWPWQRR